MDKWDRRFMELTETIAKWSSCYAPGRQIGAVIVKDGAARLKSTNALAGSTLKINIALKNIVEVTGLPIEQCIKATSWNQARNLGLQGLGKLEPGFTADITILDDDFNVKAVFIDGQQKL